MYQATLTVGQTSAPQAAGVGCVAKLTISSGSGYVQYTTGSFADITNNVATWTTWPKGTVSSTTQDTVGSPVIVRFVCVTGTVSVMLADPSDAEYPSNALAPWESMQTTWVLDSSGNATSMQAPDGPMPVGKVQARTLAVLGDSISYQNTNGSSLVLRAQGYAPWACVLSAGRLTFSNSLNFGVAGDTSTQVLARVASVMSAAPAFCVVHCGTNDVYASPSISHSTTIANLAAIYAALVGVGIVVVAVPILPRSKDASSGSMTTADRQKLQRINTWIRNAALTTPGVVLADPTLNIVDLTASNGDPLGASTAAATAYTYDGLHPAPRGAYWMGKAISDALSQFLPPASLLATSQVDTYDATNNPTGNLLTNGWFTGTGGTAGTGASGSIASSWTMRRTAGTTGAIVGSKTTDTVGNGTTYATQTAVVTAPAGSTTENLQIFQTVGSGFTAGTDVVYGEVEIQVSGVTADSLRSIQLNVQDGTNSAICLAEESGFYLPNNSWSGVLRTPAFTIAGGASTLGLYINIVINGAVASAGCTVEVCRAAIRKVQ